MIRTIVLMIVINVLFMATVFAENPAAEKYRAMIRSGNYHIVYEVVAKDDISKYDEKTAKLMKRIEEYKEKHMPKDYTEIDALNGNTMIWGSYAKGGNGSNKIEYAKALHKDGKYYSFESNKKAYVISEEEYRDYQKNAASGLTNPKESMYIATRTTATHEINGYLGKFMIFKDPIPREELDARLMRGEEIPNDAYMRNDIKYKESSIETIDGVTYDVDTYEEKHTGVLTSGGGLEGLVPQDLCYYTRVYYKDGNIYKIQDDQGNGMVFDTFFKEFTADVPADRLNVPQGCKVYKVSFGDLNSLTGKDVLAEEY